MSREYFAKHARIAAHTDPAQWPVAMKLCEVALVTGQSPQGLYRRVQKGTAQPMPVLIRGLVAKPIRFHRDAVKAYVGVTA